MTTFPKKYDALLYSTIHAIIIGHKNIDLKTVKELLDAGANPKSLDNKSGTSAYDIVNQNNHSGRYNAIIEIFEEHISLNDREMDSVEEGMPLKPEE